ncbi:MAG: phosphomannomutase/phosphoglucomutase [Myxococcales bacterium]|nr:phosphomannomutase/phosphoglucomutase [Myxococcales bacterium]
MPIFKAYDIRGVVPDELDAAAAHRIGRATARHLGAGSIAVGRDARRSSPELFEALVRGVTEEGSDVVDLGLVATPMLYFAVDHLDIDGGIMITASHNPSQYNGFKICREHAIPIGEASGLREIEGLAGRVGDEAARSPLGSVRAVDVRDDYVEHVLTVGTGRPRLRVAIDCGNGMAGVGLEPLLARLDLEVERLYFEPDGTFPNHQADPLQLENLREVSEAVRRIGADFGVAYDGDADRAVFVDETGEPISSDLMTGLLARHQLRRHPGGRVLYDLRSSRVTAEEIEKAGGVSEMCRVGHSFVKARMREVDAIFAGELSGHMYFRFSSTLVADDGIAALVALLDVLAFERKPLSVLLAPLRRYAASGEINRRVEDVPGLLAAIEREHGGAPEISHLDGLLVRYPDWWFNLRPSNTEPVLRLNLEADTHEQMVEKRDALLDRIGGEPA